jgi:ABC-2 type transport system permease protein
MNYSRIKGVFFRYFYTLKDIHQLSDIFYWPLVDILLWGLTSVWIQHQSNIPNLPIILMTALVFWQVAWRGAIGVSFPLLQEFWHRNLVNLFSTPLKISEWVSGVLLLSFFKVLVNIAFGSLVVYFLYALNVFTLGWAFLPFAAMLFIFGWSVGFLSAGLVIYWGHKVEMFAWMLPFLFAPFSAVYYPVEVLPEWAQVISWSLPTTYIFEGMRQILYHGQFSWSYLWVSLILNGIYLLISIWFFNYMFRKSLTKGLARLE